MPADLSTVFDTLLMIAGLVLVATGLVMFIYSKTSTQASSVEAFGIKLNVTHPSLILVLAGVGLMLAPRLLPEPAGRTGQPEPAAVAEAPPAQPAAPTPSANPEPAPQPAHSSTPAPAASEAAAPPATPVAKPAAVARATPPVVALARPPTKPRVAEPGVPKKTAASPKPVQPVPAPVSATAPPAEKPAAIPPVATQPVRPTLVYAALGLPINRSFWSGETRSGYTQRVRATLQRTGREVLRMDARGLDLGQAEFDAWWNESRQYPKSRALCAARPAPAALLAARVETPTTISSVESAYWPELKLRLFVCANQRIYRQQKTLAPLNDDAWPFATELNSEVERFLRTYRGDLTD